MRTAQFMDQKHPFRFSAALIALSHEGWRSTRIAPAYRGADAYIGAEVNGFLTCFTPEEVDDISKVMKRVPSLPKVGVQFVSALQACADHLREEQAAAQSRPI